MVTKAQFDRLSQRIDQVAEQMGLAQRIEYRVWLVFQGESDAAYVARHPDAMLPDGRRREPDLRIVFEDPRYGPDESADVPRRH